MKLVIVLPLLCLAGCMTQIPGKGNEPTYSGNSNGNYNEQAMDECANIAYDEFKKDPSIDADGLFVYCLKKLGVQSI